MRLTNTIESGGAPFSFTQSYLEHIDLRLKTQTDSPRQQQYHRCHGVRQGTLLVMCNFVFSQQCVAKFYTSTHGKMDSSVEFLASKLSPLSVPSPESYHPTPTTFWALFLGP